MKTIWTATLLIAIVSFASTVNGQLIPRRAVTRPSQKCKVPEANYQVNNRSRSVQEFSYRFVYLDNPLAALNQPSDNAGQEKTEIKTVTTEKEVASGIPVMSASATEFTKNIISDISEVRIRAQEQFFATNQTAADIETARNAIERAKSRAESQLSALGLSLDDTSDVLAAIKTASLEAEETLLTSGQGIAGIEKEISSIKAERSLLKEKLLKSGKLFAIEAILLPNNSASGRLGKTVETVKTKSQLFQASPGDGSATVQRDQKLFQWKEDRLKIDHCEISGIALQLNRNGDWNLNLRADQNRRTDRKRYNPTMHIKRNQFEVVLRCYGNMATSGSASNRIVGQPVLAEIKIDKFWVQNGKPNFLVESKTEDAAIASSFDSIDRVEIEFFYYD